MAFSSLLCQKNNIQNMRVETDALPMKEHCVLCKYLEEVLGFFFQTMKMKVILSDPGL